jgi:hypothetical protein
MADYPVHGSGRSRWAAITLSSARERSGTVVAIVLASAAVVTAILVGPGIHASGQIAPISPVKLGTTAPPGQQQARGELQEDPHGFLVKPYGTAQVTVPLDLPSAVRAKTFLRLWVYRSKEVMSRVVLAGANGSERSLGGTAAWVGKRFDVTDLARGGPVRLEVTSVNHLAEPVFFLDGVAPVLVPDAAVVTASTWSVALLVLLVAAALLAVFRRLRRHWPLPLALAAFAALAWPRIPPTSLDPLPAASMAMWNDVVSASWFGFHNGLLWGSWNGASSLATQLYHAFTPIVGNATVSARSAALLAALLAIAALYALGNRAAGRIGAVTAALIALAATPLRDAVVDGSALPVLVLAGTLLLYGLHACLGKATPLAVALLAAGLSLAALAEPLWLPGAAVALGVVVLVCAERGTRWRALGAGALVMLILLGPHLASTAAQNNGRLFADVDARAIAARNAEFAGGGHGAPSAAQVARDPAATGQPVTLGGYVFGDHSLAQVVGSTLSGGQRALSAFGAGASALGVLAFAFSLLGVVYVLILPRLRMLVFAPLIVALPALFVAGRITTSHFGAGAVWWPVLPVSAAILMYAAVHLAQPWLEPRLAAARTRARRHVDARAA